MVIRYEELGLTKNESLAYKTIVKHGKLGAAKISKDSGVPYSRIYDVLASLETKGLVKLVPEKTKQFVATDPDKLLKRLADKQNKLSAMAEEIKELKKFYELKVKDPVILAFGKKNFHVIAKERKPAKKISYRIKYESDTKPEFIRETRERIKQGIVHKDLVRVDEETQKNVKTWLKVHPDIKKLDNDGVVIAIRDEEVMIALIKSNVTMLVRDIPFTNIMKKLFNAYYDHAEEIKL